MSGRGRLAGLLGIMLVTSPIGATKATDLTIMTFNLRWENPADGRNVWKNRRDLAAAVIDENGVDIAGVQEALIGQLNDLKQRLPGFESVGVGRDDGVQAGEFSAILFNSRKLEVEKSGTFWLSEHPDEPGSMSWDTACTRIATWGIFRDRKSGARLFVLNTHLDHQSELARANGANLIARMISSLSAGLPTVVTGDFNATADAAPVRTLLADGFHDARKLGNRPLTPTFNGFGKATNAAEIDHILVSGGIAVTDFEVLKPTRDGIPVSDHWPVRATIEF